jgi:hypothetical protein
VRGAASGTQKFHRHLQMDAYTSVGILLNYPLQQTALLDEKFQVFKTTLFCFLFRQPSFLHELKFTQLSKLVIIILTCLREEYLRTLSCGCYGLLALRSSVS